jgi:hypothetical protein
MMTGLSAMEVAFEFLRWPVAIGCAIFGCAVAIANLSIVVLRLRKKPPPSGIPLIGTLLGMAAMYSSPIRVPAGVFLGVTLVLFVAELGWMVPAGRSQKPCDQRPKMPVSSKKGRRT